MKLTKVNRDKIAKTLTDKLLCGVGLTDAKKIIVLVKKNLTVEYKRRKNL